MTAKNRALLLAGLIVILGLLQDCAGIDTRPYNCSSEVESISGCNATGSIKPPGVFMPGYVPIYVLVDTIPLLIYLIALILFNFNLASGPAQSFIFFYQVLPTAIPIDSAFPLMDAVLQLQFGGALLWGLFTMQSPINNIAFPRILPYIALQYCKLVVALVVIVVTVLLVKCVDCPCASWRRPWAKTRRSVRHFREKYAWKGSVLNGFYVIAILTYGFVIQQSFTILQPSKCCMDDATYCSFYCTNLKLGNHEDCRFSLLVAAAVVSLVLVLPFPLLLLYYPCVPALIQRITKRSSPLISCHKLAPVFDVFQSAYKPKLRFFAAFPLLYRFLIWMLFSTFSALFSRSNRQFFITFVFILYLAIHSLVRPYRKPRHNYIEALYLVNLVLISMVSTFSLTVFAEVSDRLTPDFILNMLPAPLAYLPLLVTVCYFFWQRKCSKRCRAACCKKRVKQSIREPLQGEAVPRPPSEVYFDMDEMEQMN